MKKSAQYNPGFVSSVIVFFLLYTFSVRVLKAETGILQQEIQDKQSLLNGRIWRNQYSKVSGDQFFLSDKFLKGSLTFNGRRFNNLELMYDIADDELVLKGESNPTIILNKEMVDSFSLFFGNHIYHIINAGNDSSSLLKGYINILYEGPSALYVKHLKKIQPLAVDGRVDLFYQEHRTFLMKEDKIYQVKGKQSLLHLLSDRKKEIREYIRSSRIKLGSRDPDSFIPLLRFYDNLKK
jgi:hypothetical protein